MMVGSCYLIFCCFFLALAVNCISSFYIFFIVPIYWNLTNGPNANSVFTYQNINIGFNEQYPFQTNFTDGVQLNTNTTFNYSDPNLDDFTLYIWGNITNSAGSLFNVTYQVS